MSNPASKESLELKRNLARLLEEKQKRVKYNKIDTMFPDTGIYARKHYSTHVDFMNKGKTYNQRAIIAANRSGKTVLGACEMSYHLTGLYPKWWKGKVFKEAISAWAASVNNEATKNILQQELVGSTMDPGTGMIPKDCIIKFVRKPGVADAIETVYVKHIDGGISNISFKSYEQGRETFQGTKKQVIWLDEEPADYGIFSECLTRTAGAKGDEGLIYCTFTPLYGLSDVVLSFLPDGKMPENGIDPKNPHKFVAQVSWDEVPHLSEEWKEAALASYTPHERDARSQGRPALGSGAIYPYPEEELVVEPFEIPAWWPRAYGFDVGWNRTAAIWGAMDPDSQQIYLYSEHYVGKEVPAVHASAIKSRGKWILGAIDPRSDSSSQIDGARLLDLYNDEELNLIEADNAREAGIYKVGQLMASGRLKIFSTLRNLLSEFRIYRRDANGKIIKKNDHAMDAMRYLIMTGMEYAFTEPDPDAPASYEPVSGKDAVTGY